MEYPRFTYEHIRSTAQSFLRDHHPDGTIPVPIEQIIDNQLGIDIVPTPGLHRSFEIDAFTTSDLREIHVEEFVYAQRPNRYRFTLAHEVGHVVLHASFYQQFQWRSTSEWKRFIQQIPDDQYSWLEWHANAFAGLVLVPSDQLEHQRRRCISRIAKHLPDAKREPEAYREFLAACLAQAFEVSVEVIGRRLDREKGLVP